MQRKSKRWRVRQSLFVILSLSFILASCSTINDSSVTELYDDQALEMIEELSPVEEEAAAIPENPEAGIEEESLVINNLEAEREPSFPGSTLLGTIPYSEACDDGIELSISLWETGDKRKSMETAISLYESLNPNVDIVPEFIDHSGYWGSIALDAASGRLPDIIEMDRSHLSQFSERGLICDFSEYFPPLEGYGLPIGLKVDVMQYDEELLSALGISFPEILTSDSFFDIAGEVYEKSGIKTATSLGLKLLEAIALNNGSDIYTEILNGDTASSSQYFTLLEKIAESPFFTDSNTGCWNVFTDTTELNPLYGTVPIPGAGLDIYSLFSVSSSSEYHEEAMRFVVFLISSDELSDLFRLDFGVPPFRKMNGIEYTDSESSNFNLVASYENSNPLLIPPIGSAEVARCLTAWASLVRDGSLTAGIAAESFVRESKIILERAKEA